MNTLKILDIVSDYIVKVYNIQEKNINNIKIDSRKIVENDIFIAIKGKNSDGHNYIKDAINNGATLIIVSEEVNIKDDIMIIKVRDTIEILGVLATYIIKTIKKPVVAITGSNGKTTTKELIYDILSTKYKVLKSEGNFNNNIGLPLTIFNYDDEDIIVLEMGMNHKGEIANLVNICNPNVSIITNIGTAHIGNLGSKKNIYKAKLEILNNMENGFLIINNDDKYLKKIKTNNNRILRCGTGKKVDLQLIDVQYELTKTYFKINCLEGIYDFIINVPGKFIVYDILLSIQAGLLFNIDIDYIQKAIANYKTINNRINVVDYNNYKIINDCYNASYESLDNILSVLKNIKDEKILILGDIYELGKYNKRVLKKIIKRVNKIPNSQILLMGQNMKKIHKKIKNSIYCNTFEEMIDSINKINLNRKIILIKASHAMNFEKIYNYLVDVDKSKYIG